VAGYLVADFISIVGSTSGAAGSGAVGAVVGSDCFDGVQWRGWVRECLIALVAKLDYQRIFEWKRFRRRGATSSALCQLGESDWVSSD